MKDLRRMASDTKGPKKKPMKTMSRKAQARFAEGGYPRAGWQRDSPTVSQPASRNTSRANSDDGEVEDYVSDDTNWSAKSVDDDELEAEGWEERWKGNLRDTIDEIVNLKRSTKRGRAEALHYFAHDLRLRYARDQIEYAVSELLWSILRSIKQGSTEDETMCALKALCAMIVTLDSDDIYEKVAHVLRQAISHSKSMRIKGAAIHALSTAAFFGGASEEDMEDVMSFFLEIVESDGLSVEAHDEGTVVTAALQSWGFLATEIDDMEDATHDAMEVLIDQLESTDRDVQIAAGENIALLYEKSYTPLEPNEEVDEADLVSNNEGEPKNGERMVKRYTAWRHHDQLLHTLHDLSNISGRKVSKKAKRRLHSNFSDIFNSVEKPTRGPGYRTALNMETGEEYGAGRIMFRINRNFDIRIDKWWKLHRLAALRRVLQGGLPGHYTENEAVSRALPFSS